MAYKLTKEDLKRLNLFSMYIQSYGVKKAYLRIDVSTDGDWEVYDWDWSSDESNLSISSYDSIQLFIDNLLQESIDTLLKDFGEDDRGNLRVYIDALEKEITFSAEVYKTAVDYSSIEDTFDEISNQNVKDYLTELGNSYSTGTVHYEGSGDSGSIDSTLQLDGGDESEEIPAGLEDYFYRLLSNFGGWEINEGSQGDININFDTKTITVEHGSYYEEELNVKIPLRYKF